MIAPDVHIYRNNNRRIHFSHDGPMGDLSRSEVAFPSLAGRLRRLYDYPRISVVNNGDCGLMRASATALSRGVWKLSLIVGGVKSLDVCVTEMKSRIHHRTFVWKI